MLHAKCHYRERWVLSRARPLRTRWISQHDSVPSMRFGLSVDSSLLIDHPPSSSSPSTLKIRDLSLFNEAMELYLRQMRHITY